MGRNVILCKNCERNNWTTCNHCFKCASSNYLAKGCRNPSSDSQENWKRLLVLGNQQSKRLCPKGIIIVKNYYLRNILVVVVVNMFIFLGKKCQLRFWTHHKMICTTIATSRNQHKEKNYKSGCYSTNLTPKEKNKVAELIGDKYLIQCRFSKREKSVLLDTDAHVLIVSEDYK